MYDGRLIERLTEITAEGERSAMKLITDTLVDRVTTHNYVLRDLSEDAAYDGQASISMTEREALNKNSELRSVGSTLRWKQQ